MRTAVVNNAGMGVVADPAYVGTIPGKSGPTHGNPKHARGMVKKAIAKRHK